MDALSISSFVLFPWSGAFTSESAPWEKVLSPCARDGLVTRWPETAEYHGAAQAVFMLTLHRCLNFPYDSSVLS